MGTNSIGLVLQNYLKMNTWTDPIANTGFVETWTIFYWAWWIALGPFVGMFVTKISRGRSIRQLILGVVGFGSLGCTVYFVVLGNYALHLQLNHLLPVIDILNDPERGHATVVISVILSLPLGTWVLPLFGGICIIFMATTYDSAAYTLASAATSQLESGEHPARWHRVFWAFALGILPITLLFLGGLESLQTAAVVVSFPLIFVGVLMSMSLVRSLRQDHG